MTKPTPSQEKILKAAAKNPDCDIRDFMTHIKIRSVSEKVFQALLQNGWIAEDEASAFRITAAGYMRVWIPLLHRHFTHDKSSLALGNAGKENLPAHHNYPI